MIDDFLGDLLGEVAFRNLGASRRARLIARLFFGCLGAGLGIAGAAYMVTNPRTTNGLLLLSMICLFVSMSCFWLFNVGMGRRWKWPAVWFGLSFVLMFASRIVLGP